MNMLPNEFEEHVPNIPNTPKSSVNAYESLPMLSDHAVIIANR